MNARGAIDSMRPGMTVRMRRVRSALAVARAEAAGFAKHNSRTPKPSGRGPSCE
jgi:hypothetical protein